MSENSLPTVVCGLNEITQVSTVFGLHTCLTNEVALSKVKKLQWDDLPVPPPALSALRELLRAVSHTLPSLSMAERTSGSLTCNFTAQRTRPTLPWTREERSIAREAKHLES